MLVKLKTFKVLAESGSFTEATNRLFCSQPSVSQQIKYLENHYGTKLVTRKQNRVELTERGQLLKARADEILSLYEETENFYKKTKLSVKLCELRNLIQVSYIVIKSAMERKESRGLHYTTDYPNHQETLKDTIL